MILPTRSLLSITLISLVALSGCSSADESPSHDGESHSEEGHGEEAEQSEEGGHDGDSILVLTPEAEAAAALRLAPAESRRIGRQIETTGEVGFDEDRLAHVGPRIPGRVESVLASLGDSVEVHQVLATVDSIELGRSKAEYLQDRARHQLAVDNLEREETLFADRISSEQEFLVAQASLREAEAALATAEETLHLYGLSQSEVDGLAYDDPKASFFSLRAPFSGKIVERHATRGELVEPGTNLFTIADLSRVWVWIDVYEKDLAGVHLGDGVDVLVDTYPGEVFVGKVSYIADQVQVATRSIRARLDVPNPDGRLRAGMFARILITDPHTQEGESMEPRTVVPAGAVQRDGEEQIVFVAMGDHRFERREVVMGRKANGSVEILEGVEPGEQVVVEGAFVLKSEAAKGSMGEGHSH